MVKASAFEQGFCTNRHVRSVNQPRTQETVRRDVLSHPAFLNSQARARCKARSNLSTDEADVVCLILVRVVVEQRRTYEAIIIGKHQDVVLSAPRPGVSGFRETTVRFVDRRVVDVRSRSRLLKHVGGIVARSVVDEDEFPVVRRIVKSLESGQETGDSLRSVFSSTR